MAGRMQSNWKAVWMWPQELNGSTAEGSEKEGTDGSANVAADATRKQANGWVDAAKGARACGF